MKVRVFTAAVGVGCILLGWATWARQGASTSTTAPPALVRLQVLVERDLPMTLSVRNGDMARITIRDGSQYGVTPAITEKGAHIYLFRITPGTTPPAEQLRQLAKLPVSVNVPTGFPAEDPVFEFTMLGIEPIAAARRIPLSSGEPDAPCVRCCVTCDGVTGCACAVVMDCGSCCCKDHCTCPGDGLAATGCAAASGVATAPAVMSPADSNSR